MLARPVLHPDGQRQLQWLGVKRDCLSLSQEEGPGGGGANEKPIATYIAKKRPKKKAARPRRHPACFEQTEKREPANHRERKGRRIDFSGHC